MNPPNLPVRAGDERSPEALTGHRAKRFLPVLSATFVVCMAACAASSAETGTAGEARYSRYYEDALARYEKRDVAGAIIQVKNALQVDSRRLPGQLLLGKALLANGEAAAAEVTFGEALRLGADRAEVVLPLAQAFVAQGRQSLVLAQETFRTAGLRVEVQAPLLLLRSACSADLGDWRGALKAIDEARGLDPKSAGSWLAELPVRIRAREWREAAVAADKALALAPRSADAWYQKASVAHAAGDLRGALAGYDRAIEHDAAHAEARIARAGVRLDLGRNADAAEDVAESKRLSPREPRAAYLAALLAEREGSPQKVRASLAEVTALIDPLPIEFIRYRPQLLMLAGLAHFGLGEREKARPFLEAFQRAQGATPVGKLLARIAMAEGNADRAVEILEGYVAAQPGDGQALALLASAHLSQGRHARATALLQQALRVGNGGADDAGLRTGLGLSLLGGGRAGDAVAELERAFGADSTQTQAGAALVALFLQADQPAKALELAQRLVRQQPDDARFSNLLGTALLRSADTAGARAAFERAAALDAGFDQAQFNLARLDAASKAYDAAADRLTAVLKRHDRPAEVMVELAALAEQRGRPAEAQAWLEKAEAIAAPRDTRAGLALVELHLRHGRPSSALGAAGRTAAKRPDDLPVLLASARAQLAGRDAAAARSTLAAAGRQAGADAPQQVGIAMLQLSADDAAGARHSLDKALSANADFTPAVALLSELQLRQGDFAGAEQRARQLVQRRPTLAVGHSLLGDVALARRQPAAALDAYRRAHAVQPSTETLLRMVGALHAAGAGGDGVRLAERWVADHPADVAARKALGDGQARLGNFPAARAAYERALERAPADAELLNNLANALIRLGDAQAVRVAEQAHARRPDDADLIDTLGWASHLAGQPDRALQLLRDARLRRPASADIRYHLAAVLAKAGRRTEARDELRAALDAGRSFDGAAEARALLRTLQ